MATVENCAAFKKDWTIALHEPPYIEYFKRGENYHGDGQFEGWAEPARIAKLHRMIAVFERYGEALIELSSSISWETYNAVIADTVVEQVFPNPYFFCFNGLISLAVEHVRRFTAEGIPSTIEFVFDQQTAQEAEAYKQYEGTYSQFPELAEFMAGCDFRDDKKTPGLQAADLVAWQIRRDIVRPPEDNGMMRPEFEELRKLYKQPAQARVWRASGLAQFVANMEERRPANVTLKQES
jgi:hypothetical protein